MSTIASLSPVTLNDEQNTAANLLQQFVETDNNDIFILKGHAGTGKTMLINILIKYLNKKEIPFHLLASTGRAAKVVGEKANTKAETVHRHIYILENEVSDENKKTKKLFFKLKRNIEEKTTIYIVDECSMISDIFIKGGFTHFGSGRLLSDLLYYTRDHKCIFVGDPSQLPPINAKFSPALNKTYISEKYKKTVVCSDLTVSMRYRQNTGIWYNTDAIRKNIENKMFDPLKIQLTGFKESFLYFKPEQMIGSYVKILKNKGIDNCIFITYTNALAAEINGMIRTLLFPDSQIMMQGELLMVMQNNYKYNITNSEHIEITEIGDKENKAGLTFRDITGKIKEYNGYRILKAKIIEEVLYGKAPNLSSEQEYYLFRDFAIRTAKKGIRSGDQQFIMEMVADPYLNAIRAKFGYAVTCHKAQGGEWNDVFIIFEKMLFAPNIRENLYRWTYTAISRSSERLHFLDNYCIK